MTAIHVDRVSVSLGGAEILHEVSLDAASGTRTALVGASGSGKSTLLRVIAGFEEPSAGTVSLDDRRVSGEGRLVPAHRRGISYVPQEGALFPHLTVAGNIAFGLGGGRIRDPRVAEVADLVALDRDLLTRRPHELSGGQQQRVALARALAPRPDVVLLDEPFSALDAGLRDATRAAVVAALEATGVTAVMVTHDRAEALEFGHGLGVIEAGRIAESGDPRSLYEAPASLATARFLGPALVVGGALDGEAVTTALGRLTVGADRTASGPSAGGAVLVLIRPEQVALVVGPPAGGTAVGATVASLVEIGSRVTATLTLADGAAVSLDLPRVVAPRLAVGGSASVTVSGRVAVYDA